MSYKEFMKDYKNNLKEGVKFDLKTCAKQWNTYKSDQSQSKTSTDNPINEPIVEKKVNDDVNMGFSVSDQSKEIISKEDPEKIVSENLIDTKNTTTTYEPIVQKETHRLLSETVHSSISNILRVVTKNRIDIKEGQLRLLNDTGTHLLDKYDPNNNMLMWGPELAYMLAIADIATQVYVVRKQMTEELKKEQKRTDEKDTIQVDMQYSDEVMNTSTPNESIIREGMNL